MPKRKRKPELEQPEVWYGKCNRPHCVHGATHFPQICVPPMANGIDPLTAGPPLQLVFTVPCCKEHVTTQMSVQNTLAYQEPNGRTLKDVFICLAAGRAVPDFARAYMLAIPISEVEQQQQAAMRQANAPTPYHPQAAVG